MLVSPQVIDPELACPRFFLGGFAVEEEDVIGQNDGSAAAV